MMFFIGNNKQMKRTTIFDRYHTTLGFYEPSFFHLYTNGYGILKEIGQWDTEQKYIFLHEYVHFLQDISTIQGFNNFFIWGEYFRNVKKFIANNHVSNIITPIEPSSLKNNVDQNWLASNFTIGNDTDVLLALSYSKFHEINLTDYNNGSIIPLNVIKVRCLSIFGETEITLGSLQIMEGMASLIQEFVYPESIGDSPYNPYYIAKDIADMIMPGISLKPLVMLSLYDYSLQASNPGWAFVNYLEEKVRGNYTADTLTAEMVYEDLSKTSITLSEPFGKQFFPNSLFGFADGAKDVMSEYLNGSVMWNNIDRWFQDLVDTGKWLRKKHPNFFLLLMQDGDIAKNKMFKYLIKKTGTPIISNDGDDFDFVRPLNSYISKREMVYMYAMMQVQRVFLSSGDDFRCPLIKYCENASCIIDRNKVDSNCYSTPWKRKSICPCYFSTWWNYMGLNDIQINRP